MALIVPEGFHYILTGHRAHLAMTPDVLMLPGCCDQLCEGDRQNVKYS